jgi:hypothetical protein
MTVFLQQPARGDSRLTAQGSDELCKRHQELLAQKRERTRQGMEPDLEIRPVAIARPSHHLLRPAAHASEIRAIGSTRLHHSHAFAWDPICPARPADSHADLLSGRVSDRLWEIADIVALLDE